MAGCGEGCGKCLLYVFNGILWFLGLGCLAVGIWMKADKNVVAWFMLLRRNPSDDSMSAAAVLLIIAGLTIIGVGFLGCCGAMKQNKMLLSLYLFALAVIFALQLAAGFLVVHFRHDLHRHVKQGMRDQIKNGYEWENSVGHGWNRAQVRLRCCGADGSWDYKLSDWWYGQNPGVETEEQASIFVPISCCKLDFNQDRDVSRVDPQDPRPKDARRCQEDAAGMKDGSDYLNGRGCYAALLDFVQDHMFIIIGIGIGIGIFQICVFIAAVCMLMNVRNKDE